jgi:HEAT repeat protein
MTDPILDTIREMTMPANPLRVDPADEVDRAVVATRRGTGRLVALLGSGDGGVIMRAARALLEVGPFAFPSLDSALPRAAELHHRLAIVGMLETIGLVEGAPVTGALLTAYRRRDDPIVRSRAAEALARVAGARVYRQVIAGADRPPPETS